jgi:hypothetical protein
MLARLLIACYAPHSVLDSNEHGFWQFEETRGCVLVLLVWCHMSMLRCWCCCCSDLLLLLI